MKTTVLLLLAFCCLDTQAQYYYNDIVGTLESNRQMKAYVANKVRLAKATGIDREGRPSTDFSELQEVRENGTALRITTNNNAVKTQYYNRFDNQGRLMTIIDSSTYLESVTNYEYDAAGKITLVKNSVEDTANDFNQVEVHQWIYAANGIPEKMWRIINNTDSLEVRFKADEHGNAGEERSFRRGVETGVLYYYYDEKNRLTDIVRYNTRLKKLMPDIMFEYDEKDRVVQKITTTSSLHLGYLIWRYIFDEKGLKTKEALFNNDKELTGKIEYTYAF